MRKILRYFAIFIIFALVTGTLVGCKGTPAANSEKTAVCFVIGRHANSQPLNMNCPIVTDTVYNVVKNYGYIGVVNVDGKPKVVHGASCDIEDRFKDANEAKLEKDARAATNKLLTGMSSVVAKEPEADYFNALQASVKLLKSLDGYTSKKIIVLGTGLSTTGILNFANNLLSAEPADVVNMLKAKSEIPDFTNITVNWLHMGDVSDPQQQLSGEQRSKLQEIYKGIVETGGGTFICNETVSVANAAELNVSQLPSVTPIEFPEETPIRFDPADFEETSDEEEQPLKEPVILDEVTFIADKAEYIDPDKAIKTLRSISNYIIRYPTLSVMVAGTTAGGSDSDFTLSLSRARAEAVKSTLVSLGVDENKITAIGLGCKDPWHICDEGDELAASFNRKVVILDITSKSAVSILKQFGS